MDVREKQALKKPQGDTDTKEVQIIKLEKKEIILKSKENKFNSKGQINQNNIRYISRNPKIQ